MSGNWMSWMVWLSLRGFDQVTPWSVERTKYTLESNPLLPSPVNRDQEKYTLSWHEDVVRSASMAVLSLNFPLKDAEPLATVSVPWYSSPSFCGSPSGPSGLTYRATHESPFSLNGCSGSPELSDPMKTRPSPSHAITGSPASNVRMWARGAYGEVSSGYPGMSELTKLCPPSSDR